MDELKSELSNIKTQLDFSNRANASLKDDYDLLQSKLDKTMKTANNQVTIRDEQIQKLSQQMTGLENFYEEHQ